MDPRMEQRTPNIIGMENPYIAKVIQTQPQVREALGAEPPVKEVRTYIRDGTTITEEYERLNPDGTVTKTVSVGDRRDGMKHFGVYKMDKSGIIRRIDNAEQAVNSPNQSSSYDQYARQQQVKEEEEQAMSYGKPPDSVHKDSAMHYQTHQGPGINGYGSYSQPENGHHIIDPTQGPPVQTQKQFLTPEQKKHLLRNYKDKIIQYGSKKLEKLIKQKLESNKMNKIFSLTDAQKEKLVAYGINRFENLLNEHLDEDKIISEAENYMNKKNAHSFPQANMQNKIMPNHIDRPISFAFQPSEVDTSTVQQHPPSPTQQRPVSFKIRPESVARPYPAMVQPQYKPYGVQDKLKSIWKESPAEEKLREQKELHHQQQKLRDRYRDEEDDELNNLEKVQMYSKENGRNRKERLDKEDKEDSLYYALKRLKKLVKEPDDKYKERKEAKYERLKQLEREAKQQQRDEKYKKYFSDLGDLFEDEDDENVKSMKSLKKFLRKNGENPTEERETQEKQQTRGASYAPSQYQQTSNGCTDKDTYSQQPYKANEGFSRFQIRPQANAQPKPENVSSQQEVQGSKWDFGTFISKLMEEKPKKSNADPASTQKTEKKSNFDSFLSRIRQRVVEKRNGNDSSSPRTEQPSKDKGAYSYQSRPQVESKTKTESEASKQKQSEGFDFDSLLSFIRQSTTGVKGDMTSQKKESSLDKNSGNYQTQPRTEQIRNNGYSSSIDKDSSLNRIRRTMSQNSATNAQPNQTSARTQTTSSSGAYRNHQNDGSISFQIQPQQPSKSSLEPGRPKTIQRVNGGPYDELPWWFSQNSEPTFLRQPMLKDPVTQKPHGQSSFVENPLLGDSFFSTNQLGGSFFTNSQLPKF